MIISLITFSVLRIFRKWTNPKFPIPNPKSQIKVRAWSERCCYLSRFFWSLNHTKRKFIIPTGTHRKEIVQVPEKIGVNCQNQASRPGHPPQSSILNPQSQILNPKSQIQLLTLSRNFAIKKYFYPNSINYL